MKSSINRIKRVDWEALDSTMAELLKPATRDSVSRQNFVQEVSSSRQDINRKDMDGAQSFSTAVPSNGDFEFFEELFNDEWMSVHAAYDRRLNRDVTIRKLKPQAQSNSELTHEFWNRASRLACVDHPNVARVHAVDPSQGWIILERLKESVADRLSTGYLFTPAQALSLFKQALAGLEAFHERCESHAAVCLENMALSKGDVLKLTDPQGFALHAELELPAESRRHLAPEFLNSAEFGEVGLATDLYCLGFAILTAMAGPKLDALVSQAALSDNGPEKAWLHWHASPRQQLPPLDSFIEGISPEFEQALISITRKKVSLRPPHAGVVLQQLNQNSVAVPPPLEGAVTAMEVDDVNDLDQFRLHKQTSPGAIMLGENASVYSIPDELIEEQDMLDKLTDTDWLAGQIQRPAVFLPLIGAVLCFSFLLLSGKQTPKLPVVADGTTPGESPVLPAISNDGDSTQVKELFSEIDVFELSSPPHPPLGERVAIAARQPVGPPKNLLEEVKPVPVKQIVDLPSAWPLETLAEEQVSVHDCLQKMLNTGFESDANELSNRHLYEVAQRYAPQEPRVGYAYGLSLIASSHYGEAVEVLQQASRVQNALFREKNDIFSNLIGDKIPENVQPIPYFHPHQMHLWALLMEADRHQHLVKHCANEIENVLRELNVQCPHAEEMSQQVKQIRRETVDFAGDVAGVLSAHFRGRLSSDVNVRAWGERCERLLSSQGNGSSTEEIQIFRLAMSRVAQDYDAQLEENHADYEKNYEQKLADYVAPTITREQTITRDGEIDRWSYIPYGTRKEERRKTSTLKIEFNQAWKPNLRQPNRSDIELRKLLPADLLYRRGQLQETIPVLFQTTDVVVN